MKNYIVYDQIGKILRTGTCPDNMILIQVGDGEFVMEGKANDIEDRIVESKVVRKTQVEINTIRKAMEPDLNEMLIQNRMNEIVRRMAIDELKKEGKL